MRCTSRPATPPRRERRRAEAKRLYDLKGATVPAERLVDERSATAVLPVTPIVPRHVDRAAAPGDERTPRAVNRCVQVMTRLGALLGQWDEARSLLHDDLVSDDRRRLVGDDPVRGIDAAVAANDATADVGLVRATGTAPRGSG